MGFHEELRLCVKAGIPALYVETTEWERFKGAVDDTAEDENKKVKYWNEMRGLYDNKESATSDSDYKAIGKTIEYIMKVRKLEEDKQWDITVLEYADKNFIYDEDTPVLISILLRMLRDLKHQIIIYAPTLVLPEAVKNEFTILDLPLPDRDHIKNILNEVAQITKKVNEVDTGNAILDSVRGLGTTEIRNAFSKIIASKEKITAEEISDLISEKEQIIRKSGYLEFIKTDIKPDDVGGLEELKDWLGRRKDAFGEKAQEKKLASSKGVLLLGIPGTGKSLSAKATASIWKFPLLRLDIGKIFGGLVGESEANIRNTIKIAESLAPCILWIDEIEKGLSSSTGERDGGTSSRVFGTFLTWLQEKQKEVFVFATANDISKLPPELLRKGRFDELFFVDLPNRKAREKIFKIHLAKKEQKVEITDEILDCTNGFSGAEIESIVNEAHFMAYEENQEETRINSRQLFEVCDNIIPLSKLMSKNITELREWGKVRCKLASQSEPPIISNGDKELPLLPQEKENIFSKKNNSS